MKVRMSVPRENEWIRQVLFKIQSPLALHPAQEVLVPITLFFKLGCIVGKGESRQPEYGCKLAESARFV